MEKTIVRQNNLEQQIADLVTPIVASQGCELVRIKVTGLKGHAKVALFVDVEGAAGTITMDQLEQINRVLGDAMDVWDTEHHWFNERYDLEVSSPGLDRPLSKMSHFTPVIGQPIRLKIDGSGPKSKTLNGVLKSVDDNGVIIDDANIPWTAIRDASLVYQFPQKNTGKKRRA
jgi:ribosome maturation factor RimP